MRYVVMLLIGLFMGAMGAVAAVSAMRQGTPYNDAVMTVIGRQTGAMRAMREANSCGDTAEITRRLQILRNVAGETNDAFLPVGDDELFRKHSAALVAAADRALASPPADCDTLGAAMSDIGASCKSCHEDFR